jgi:hypothetical protein
VQEEADEIALVAYQLECAFPETGSVENMMDLAFTQ